MDNTRSIFFQLIEYKELIRKRLLLIEKMDLSNLSRFFCSPLYHVESQIDVPAVWSIDLHAAIFDATRYLFSGNWVTRAT